MLSQRQDRGSVEQLEKLGCPDLLGDIDGFRRAIYAVRRNGRRARTAGDDGTKDANLCSCKNGRLLLQLSISLPHETYRQTE